MKDMEHTPQNLPNQNAVDSEKVSFLVVGAQKSGTSALDTYLRRHPEISMANVKETHFFDNETLFSKEVDYSRYHEHFQLKKSGNQLWGESTPIYMYWSPSMRRIWEYKPDIKMIISLRHPSERAYSHWNMEVSRGNENLDFHTAITSEIRAIKNGSYQQDRVKSYIDRGFYSKQIERIWSLFPKENTLIFKSQELKESPPGILEKISQFLNISSFPDLEPVMQNTNNYQSTMEDRSKALLRETYDIEITRLEAILGWNCSEWR